MPLVTLDWITLLCVSLSVMAAASAGIGGGGLLVPVFLLVAQFPAPQATPLSSATISGGAIANFWTYSRRWHPKFEQGVWRPLIEYELGLLLMPALLCGTVRARPGPRLKALRVLHSKPGCSGVSARAGAAGASCTARAGGLRHAGRWSARCSTRFCRSG